MATFEPLHEPELPHISEQEPAYDPVFTTLAREQDRRWTFPKLMLLFLLALVVPLAVILTASWLIAG